MDISTFRPGEVQMEAFENHYWKRKDIAEKPTFVFINHAAMSTIEIKQVDFWDDFTDDQKAEIEESIAQADRCEVMYHEQVVKDIKARYKL